MKRAFTLIEIVVALSIMLVLAGLTISIMQSVREGNREAATRLTLQAVNSILSEHTRSVGVNVYPREWYHDGVYGPHNTAGPGLWIAPFRAWNTAQARYVIQPTIITDAAIPDDPAMWNSDLLRNTVIAFNAINKTVGGTKINAMKTVQVTATINGAAVTTRIPTDAWGRPILFSPAVGVTVDGVTVLQQSTAVANDARLGTAGGTFPFCFSAGKNGKLTDVTAFVR
jgi:prepilin-type N-terminal cleavage/methylation domain-containing protein